MLLGISTTLQTDPMPTVVGQHKTDSMFACLLCMFLFCFVIFVLFFSFIFLREKEHDAGG